MKINNDGLVFQTKSFNKLHKSNPLLVLRNMHSFSGT